MVGIAAACGLALLGLPKLRVNNTAEVWFSDKTPSYATYQSFAETFGKDEYLFIAIDFGNVFTERHLRKLDQLSEEIKRQSGVEEVMSLTESADIWTQRGEESADGIGVLSVSRVRDRMESVPPDILKQRILADERYVGTLVSQDGRVGVILVRFETAQAGTRLIPGIERILTAEGVTYHLGGYIFAQHEMDRLTFRDYFLFGTICLVMLTLIFVWLFRDSFLTFLFIGDCVITVGVVLGCMGHLGVPIHLMTGILPPLLMAMAIADDLHLIERYLKCAGEAAGRAGADQRLTVIARASSEVAIPSLLSGLTTFAGFFSLSGGAIPAIGHFGFWSGIGILFTYFFSFLTIPIFLTWFPAPKAESVPIRIQRDVFRNHLWRFSFKHKNRLILAFVLLGLIALLGIPRIVVDTQLTNFFKAESRFMRSMDFIERRFGNTGPVEIVLTASQVDGLKRVDVLRKTDLLIERLKQLPNVETVLSLNPVIKTIHRSLHEEHPDAYRLPDRPELLEQELLLLSLSSAGEDTLHRYVNPSWTWLRIQVRLPRMGNNEALALFDQMEMAVRDVFGPRQAFFLTGVVEAYSRLDQFILESQLKSLAITLAVISLVFWLQVGRLVWALLALLPNIFPIVLMFASMGWCGITLNVATVTVAAITLGLADDDTIYFFYSYLRRRKSGMTAEEALPGTMDECGMAIWLSTVLNVVGFSIFVFSSFRPTVYFGALTSEVWVTAILAEFFLLPALLLKLDRKLFLPSRESWPGPGV